MGRRIIIIIEDTEDYEGTPYVPVEPEELEKPEWMCAGYECTNRLEPNRFSYCIPCRDKRKKYFKRKYYEDKGWDTTKLDEMEEWEKKHCK